MSIMTERILLEVRRQMDRQSFESRADVDDFMARFIGKPIEESIVREGRPPEAIAQDLAYQALEAEREESFRLAREALKYDPDCSDAHLVLARAADTVDEAMPILICALDAAERKLPPDAFISDDYVGRFWDILETRPYMRARHLLAKACDYKGDGMGAIGHYREMLRLNLNDNQGIRYELAPLLVVAGHDQEADDLLAAYSEDASSAWPYLSALLLYRAEGPSPAAEKALRRAFRANPNVILLLATDDPCEMPDSYQIGEVDEAVLIVRVQEEAWMESPGFPEWMREVALDFMKAAIVREMKSLHGGRPKQKKSSRKRR